MTEPLTEAEYEPIRAALFDVPRGQSAEAAKQKIAENLIAAGLRIVKNDPDHYVCFTEDTWFIEHSLDCRINGTIGTCEFNHAILDITSQQAMPDPRQLGRWRITGIDSEGLPSLEHDVRDGPVEL
jgi:hypothetical protein